MTNTWGAVQAYYITYHATQAYSVAKGNQRPDSHPKTQNEFATRWLNRPLDLPPWTFGAGPKGFKNSGGRTIDPTVHPWTAVTDESAWHLAGKAFDSTRQGEIRKAEGEERKRRQGKRRRDWRATEQARLAAGKPARNQPHFPLPLLNASEKKALADATRAYGLIDYLYRLRITTNYEDSSVFTDGPDDDLISSQVHRDLTYVASATLLVHELHVGRLVAKATLMGWVDSWVGSHLPPGMDVGLGVRRDTLRAFL